MKERVDITQSLFWKKLKEADHAIKGNKDGDTRSHVLGGDAKRGEEHLCLVDGDSNIIGDWGENQEFTQPKPAVQEVAVLK